MQALTRLVAFFSFGWLVCFDFVCCWFVFIFVSLKLKLKIILQQTNIYMCVYRYMFLVDFLHFSTLKR